MKYIIPLALIMCTSLISIADSDNPSTSTSGPQPISLKPTPRPTTRPNRMPAKPIFGEFANQVLYIFLDEADNTTYTLNVSKDNLTMETVILSADELIDGYTVNVAAPFTVELTFENGTTYSGEIN